MKNIFLFIFLLLLINIKNNSFLTINIIAKISVLF